MGSVKYHWFFLVVLVLFLVSSIPYLLSQSINADEGSYSRYAIRYLKGDPSRSVPRVDNSMMPVIAWNMVPRVVQQVVQPAMEKQDEGRSDIMNGRFMSLLIGMIIIWVIYAWGSEMFNQRTGLMAAFMFSICPNSLANAAFASTDIYSVLIVLATAWLFWRVTQYAGRRDFILLAIVVALGQVTKQSLTYLYVLIPLMVVATGFYKRYSWRRWLAIAGVFILLQWFVINLVYYGYHSFMPMGEYRFMSESFQGLQHVLPTGFRVPMPEPYITGLDQALYYNHLGGGINGQSCFGKVTILGSSFTGEGIWYYYFVTLLFKTPLPLLICLVAAMANWKADRLSTIALFLPVVFFILVMSFFYQVQAGIRHIIFIYPLLFLVCAHWASRLWEGKWRWAMIVAALLWIASVSRYWGNFYPYTNELIWDKKNAWRWVGHANLDIHQGYFAAQRYLAAHPDIQSVPSTSGHGKFLVNVNDYLDIWNTGQFEWVNKYPVSGEVAFNWLIVEVP